MYYFDKQFLQQYLDLGQEVKVYVNGQYLSIADYSDLEDDVYGMGYDFNGAPSSFNYKDVQAVQTGQFELDIDQLQAKLDGKDSDEDEQEQEDGQDGEQAAGDEEEQEEQPQEGEPAPQEEEEPPQEAYTRHKRLSAALNETYKVRYGITDKYYGAVVEISQGDFAGAKGWVKEYRTYQQGQQLVEVLSVKLLSHPHTGKTIEVYKNNCEFKDN